MKKSIVLFFAILSLLAGNAFAQGFTAGASIGYAKIEDSESGLSIDANDTGFKIFGAYNFNENWGVEAGYIDFNKPSTNVLGTDLAIEANGFDVYGVGMLPAGEDFDLFGKVGVIAWDAKGFVDGVESGDDSGTDLALGIGARWKSSGAFGIRGEWEWFNISDADTVWMFSLGAELRF